ncbi:MAG: hypothetical protein ACLKAL_08695 [Alkaliphilus sp.]
MKTYEEIVKIIEKDFRKNPMNIIKKALHYAVWGEQGGTCRIDLETSKLYSMIQGQKEMPGERYIDVLEIGAFSPLLEELELELEEINRDDLLLHSIAVLSYEGDLFDFYLRLE